MKTPTIKTFLAALGVLVLASVATGQPAPPPPIGDIPKPPTMLYYFVAFVLLGATIVVSILPAKRRDHD